MGIRSSQRLVIVLAVIAAAVLGAAAPAAAQAIEVPRGSGFTVENGTECAPNTDVAIFFSTPSRQASQIGSTISDQTGHFEARVTVPADVALGPGTVTVDCDIPDAVLLYDIEIVAAETTDLLAYAPYALGGVAVLALLLVVLARRGRNDDEAQPEAAEVAAETAGEPAADAPDGESPGAVRDEAAPVDEDDEDGPDYWFWDANTERGPAKRLACLTDTTFYLHEVPADAFSALLEQLSATGPDDALSRAFFKIAVDDIDEIRHRGTELRVTFRGPNGFVSRTIDLATEVDGVVGLLSRRVPVMAEAPPVPSA